MPERIWQTLSTRNDLLLLAVGSSGLVSLSASLLSAGSSGLLASGLTFPVSGYLVASLPVGFFSKFAGVLCFLVPNCRSGGGGGPR